MVSSFNGLRKDRTDLNKYFYVLDDYSVHLMPEVKEPSSGKETFMSGFVEASSGNFRSTISMLCPIKSEVSSIANAAYALTNTA